MGGKLVFLLVSFLLFASICHAATIYGTVYDLELKKITNAKVEINTNPKQAIVAANGTYSFNVPNGKYFLKAYVSQKNSIISFVNENITVSQDGKYVLDLILFPDVEEGLEDPNLDVNGDIIQNSNVWIYVLLVLLLVLLAGFVIIAKKAYKKKELAENNIENAEHKLERVIEHELDLVVSIIKKEGGRATQKEIRKQIPLSEAKISLMIAELEHKGIVEKIKKGRGNIVILKKK